MDDLSTKKCVPCEGGLDPISLADAKAMLEYHVPSWSISEGDGLFIYKEFKFNNFKESLDFVNMVGELAEGEGHHPDIEFGWGWVKIILTTHSIGGLSQNDFILASKINNLFK